MKDITRTLESLPSFGRIDWHQTVIPHVAKGPKGGISGTATVLHQDRIVVTGGFIPGGDGTGEPGNRTSRWCHAYDVSTSTWTRLTDMPFRREYLRGILSGDALYLLGGAAQHPDGYVPYADVIAGDLNQPSLRWTPAGHLTEPLTHMAVGKVGHHLVVAGGNHYDRTRGGYDESTIRDTVNVLDLRQEHAGWQNRTSIPGRGRGWCGYATCRDRLFLFGGLTWVEKRPSGLREALSYDPVTDTWTHLAPPPLPVGGWSAAVCGDRYVLLVGGVVWAGVQETADEPAVSRQRLWSPYILVYDVQEDRWVRVEGEIVRGRAHGGYVNDTGVCLVGSTVYAVGGEGTKGTHTNYLRVGEIDRTA